MMKTVQFYACFILSAVFAATILSKPSQAEPPETRSKSEEKATIEVSQALDHWLRHARRYAEKIPPQEADIEWNVLLMMHASRGDLEQAVKVSKNIQQGSMRKAAPVFATMSYLKTGDVEGAIRFVETQLSGEQRDLAFMVIVQRLAEWHQFDAAQKTVHRIKAAKQINRAWRSITREQARAGLYDAADKSLSNLKIVNDGDRMDRKNLQEIIENARREKTKNAPVTPRGKFTDRTKVVVRDVLLLFGADDPESAEEKASAIDDPLEKSLLLAYVADAYHLKKKIKDSTRVAQKILAIAKSMKNPHHRAIPLGMLAHYYQLLGQKDRAMKLAAESLQLSLQRRTDVEEESTYLDYYHMLRLTRVLLVNGQEKEIFKLLNVNASFNSHETCWMIGQHFAKQKRLKILENRLGDIENSEAQFHVCIGVCDYLISRLPMKKNFPEK